MAHVFPFRAFRYNPQLAPFQNVLTQPYDKILPEMQAKYTTRIRQNLITVEKGREFPATLPATMFIARRAAFKEWEAEKRDRQDAAPSFYAYTQKYRAAPRNAAAQRIHRRRPAREYSARDFPPRAHALRPKADRLELLRNTRTHTGQLFMPIPIRKSARTHFSRSRSAAPPPPKFTMSYGVTHRLWVVSDTQKASRFSPRWRTRSSSLPTAITVTETALNFATSVAQKRVSPIHTRHTKMR